MKCRSQNTNHILLLSLRDMKKKMAPVSHLSQPSGVMLKERHLLRLKWLWAQHWNDGQVFYILLNHFDIFSTFIYSCSLMSLVSAEYYPPRSSWNQCLVSKNATSEYWCALHLTHMLQSCILHLRHIWARFLKQDPEKKVLQVFWYVASVGFCTSHLRQMIRESA